MRISRREDVAEGLAESKHKKSSRGLVKSERNSEVEGGEDSTTEGL